MSDTDTIKGLTQEQVDKLTADGLFNETVKSQSKSVCQIVAGNVFTSVSYTHLTLPTKLEV